MDYLVHSLLPLEVVDDLVDQLLEHDSWIDGKRTAGKYAASVKSNFQLDRSSDLNQKIVDIVINKIQKDLLLRSFCLPRKVHGVMCSKTLVGQGYGAHVDNAYMSTGRSDLSFTLFLSDPKSYEGGELSIQTIQDQKSFKLNPGELIVYPSNTIHSVEEVTYGERLVCVGWIHSYIPSNEDRNSLFCLDSGAKSLLAEHGQSPELDLIFQAYNNFLRRLGE